MSMVQLITLSYMINNVYNTDRSWFVLVNDIAQWCSMMTWWGKWKCCVYDRYTASADCLVESWRQENTPRTPPVHHSTNTPWHAIQTHSQTNAHTVDTVLLVTGMETLLSDLSVTANYWASLTLSACYKKPNLGFLKRGFLKILIVSCLLNLTESHLQEQKKIKTRGWHNLRMRVDINWQSESRIQGKELCQDVRPSCICLSTSDALFVRKPGVWNTPVQRQHIPTVLNAF